MARWWRRLRQPVVLGGCIVLAAASVAGAMAPDDSTPAEIGTAGGTVRLLQMNLCDSGVAHCYTGRSVREAAEVIRAVQPDVVTLNEVCQRDLSALGRALSASPPVVVVTAFAAAVDRDTDGPVHCVNAQDYGIGLLSLSSNPNVRTRRGTYPVQDTSDPEERVWLCLQRSDGLTPCTTHLASTSRSVALRQCRDLFDRVLPALSGSGRGGSVVLGADLNLRADRSPNVESCLPSGYVHADDGASQYVVATDDLVVASSNSIDLHGSTDHPGLLVDLAPVSRQPTLRSTLFG
jgi:endonuclease/exonuclease/phosphatase family metal-dependent hydrolase